MRIVLSVVLLVTFWNAHYAQCDSIAEESGLRGSSDVLEAVNENHRRLTDPVDVTENVTNITVGPDPTDPADDELSSVPRTKGNMPFGRCKGDCDTSDDCLGDLVCTQRAGNPKVYGCKGTPEKSVDYCVDPPKGDPIPLEWCGEEPPNKIGRCQGDCDRDKDCMPGLYCYKRKKGNLNPIPGCEGLGIPGADYCVPIGDPPTEPYPQCPETPAPTPDPTAEPTSPPTSPPTPSPTAAPIPDETPEPTLAPGDPRPPSPTPPPTGKPTSRPNPCSICYSKLPQSGINRHYLHKILVYFKYMCEKCTTKRCVHYKFKVLEKLRYSTRRRKRCSSRQNHVWQWCNREAAKYRLQKCP